MKIIKNPFVFLPLFLLILNGTYAYVNRRFHAHAKLANTYYVKLSSSPFTSSPDHIEAQHSTFHEELKKLGIEAKIGHTFKRYANGITIEIDEQHVKRIADIEQVESIEPVKLYTRFKSNKPFDFIKEKLIKRNNDGEILIAPHNDINSVHEVTGVKKTYEKLGIIGKGVKVGIVDSGIDYRHPALGGCFGPGCRVAHGYNFVDDNNDPFDDCDGHGTHVAGIIGGLDPKTGFRGVAPNVTFGAYKMLPCDSNAPADAYSEGINPYSVSEILLMRSIERAVDDGMQIINLSLGGPGNARTPSNLMINELAKYKGIIFLIAVGNDGANGVFTDLSPGTAREAIGVCSVDTNKFLNFRAFDPKNPKFVLNYMKANTVAYSFKKAKLKYLTCLKDYKSFNNSVIVVDNRKILELLKCDFGNKFENITILGEMDINYELDEGIPPPSSLPVVSLISTNQADNLIKYLEEHPNLELDFSDKRGFMVENQFALNPSIFSGWGLTDELDIKPEICAPGGLILSSFPINLSPYQIESGTSMSSPYMAGVAALYLEVFGEQKSSEQLKTALMNYAVPRKDRNKLLSPVLHQGAGFVNLYDTLRATSFVYPSKIDLNDTIHFNKYHTLTIYNSGRKEMKYKLSHKPAPSVNGYNKTLVRNYSQLKYLTNKIASVTFEKDLITVAPGARVKVSVTFTPPTLPKNEHWLYSGWLEVIPLDNTNPLMSVPYAGLADDSRRLPLFQTPNFPLLANETNLISEKDKLKTFTYNGTDVPIIRLNLATPTHKIFTEILDDKRKFLGSVKTYYDFPFQKGSDFVVWDGIIYDPNYKNNTGIIAPDGKYFLRVKALKLFGDINNEDNYEVWVSPKFRIKRSV